MEFGVRKHERNRGLEYRPVGNFVHWHIYQNKLSKSKLAKDLDILPTTLNQYLKQDTLQFAILWKISKALNHNFLASLAEYLQIPYETHEMKAMQEQLEEKNKIIEKLEMQLSVYSELMSKR